MTDKNKLADLSSVVFGDDPNPTNPFDRTGGHGPEGVLFNTDEASIVALIVENLAVEAHRVTRQANFMDDLGADSLDLVELVMDAEERFEIEISDDEAEKINTVQDAFDVIAVARAHEADAK